MFISTALRASDLPPMYLLVLAMWGSAAYRAGHLSRPRDPQLERKIADKGR